LAGLALEAIVLQLESKRLLMLPPKAKTAAATRAAIAKMIRPYSTADAPASPLDDSRKAITGVV
jgi:hypothetical protein